MGAITIAGTWRIAASRDDVWRVVADLETWPRWWPAIREVVPLDGGRDGGRFTFDTPSPLPPLPLELTVVERTAPNGIVATATDGPLTGNATLALRDEEGCTAVAFDVRLRIRSLLFRPLGSVLVGATRGAGRDRLRQAGDDLAELAGGLPLDHEV